MKKTILIVLNNIGLDAGPFTISTNVDGVIAISVPGTPHSVASVATVISFVIIFTSFATISIFSVCSIIIIVT